MAEKKLDALPEARDTLLPARKSDVLKADKAWSFVTRRRSKRWLWTVINRRTRQVVAHAIGGRGQATCRELWRRIPEELRCCRSFSDFWQTYAEVFPKHTHRHVGKQSGETAYLERWYATLRNRLGRFSRKTLSFSKSEWWHERVTHWFIVEYNCSIT